MRAVTPRRQYIDWLRGVAVLIMVMWHVVDSWHVREGRDARAFQWLGFFAGWAAPLFLFLAGLSMALSGAALVKSGVDRRRAAWTLAKRGAWVLLIAHAFRFQSFLFNPYASWNGILKPDILNILGLGLVAAALLWSRASTAVGRVLWLAVPAIVVVFMLAPLAPTWWWPTLLHPRLEAYIRPVGNMGVFSLFPAVAFVLAGAFVGGGLGDRAPGPHESRFLERAALVGGVLVAMGVAASPLLSAPEVRWLQPATVVAWRTGAMVLLLALSNWWVPKRPLASRHPLMLFGRASLFVYWVHVELAYGSVSFLLWKALPLPWVLLAYLVFTSVMYGLTLLWTQRPRGPFVQPHLVPAPGTRLP